MYIILLVPNYSQKIFKFIPKTLNHYFLRIGEIGSRHLAALLKECQSITCLELSGNPLGDEGSAYICSCIGMHIAGFLEEDNNPTIAQDSDSVATVYAPHNRSLTHLNLSSCGLNKVAADSLGNLFKGSQVLTSIRLDFNQDLKAKDLKYVMNSLRAYNVALQRLSFAETPLSAKTVGYIARIVENISLPLQRLDLSHCGMIGAHIGHLAKFMTSAKFLSYLNVSSNDIGEEGAYFLSLIIRGKVDVIGTHNPPLHTLDMNFCGVEADGCKEIFDAISTRPTLTSLNISNNRVGDDVASLRVSLSQARFSVLRMNGCQLGTKGASNLFDLLSNTHEHLLGHTLRALYLAENEINDSAALALNVCLKKNFVLEVLDLGFNSFTSNCADTLRQATSVSSSSNLQVKLLGLSVNMIGNKCDPYILETPGMARSKVSL